ncbi:hypothetical protein SAY87_023501 [Trapa incisa]|uniref:Uncharacterized protein n=1 Tax=Trapa incisa TaxID=236973 RepID=A0AAN7L5Q5_9MYRT|nr:hypothetical protein SAY87_023501 [Trapa incisa]
MALPWYDFFCVGLVAVAAVGSLWVIWRKEGGARSDDNKLYESLLVGSAVKPVGHVDSSWLWSSCWRDLHPGWLLVVRLVSLVVLTVFLIQDISVWDSSIFVYYTEWTFSLVMIYFGLGSILSAYGCWVYAAKPTSGNMSVDEFLRRDLENTTYTSIDTYRGQNFQITKPRSQYTEEDILQRAGFWGYLMQIAYQTSAGAVILTDIVFWCVIVPFLSNARLGLNMLMGCMHILNLVFLLIDTSVNSLPFPWFRISYFVLWSCMYVIFQWIIHVCGFPWWPYPFLELSSPWCSLWYFVMAIAHIPCYAIYALINKTKNSVFARMFPHAFIRRC